MSTATKPPRVKLDAWKCSRRLLCIALDHAEESIERCLYFRRTGDEKYAGITAGSVAWYAETGLYALRLAARTKA